MKQYHTLPEAFLTRLQQILPEAQYAEAQRHLTRPLPRTIRTAPGFTAPQGWTLRLAAGIPEAFFLDREDRDSLPLGKTFEHFSGQIYSATLSSLLSVAALAPEPEEKVLDMCAAPGSKTTFLSARMGNTGVLAANEPSSSRIKKLSANLERMGVENTVIMREDGRKIGKMLPGYFDRVLLDAPCSSEGFGRKDSRYFAEQWRERNIIACSRIQKDLIISAFESLRPGGVMVYSTCTSAPEENEAVVQHLLENAPGAQLCPIQVQDVPHHPGLPSFSGQDFHPDIGVHAWRLYPHLCADGWDSELFFIARIQKSEESPVGHPKIPATSVREFDVLSPKKSTAMLERMGGAYGMPPSLWKEKMVVVRAGEGFLTTKEAANLARRVFHLRVGLPVSDRHRNITTAWAMHYAPHATKLWREITNEEWKTWTTGADITLGEGEDFPDRADILLRKDGHGAGYGRIMGRTIKNKVDRSMLP